VRIVDCATVIFFAGSLLYAKRRIWSIDSRLFVVVSNIESFHNTCAREGGWKEACPRRWAQSVIPNLALIGLCTNDVIPLLRITGPLFRDHPSSTKHHAPLADRAPLAANNPRWKTDIGQRSLVIIGCLISAVTEYHHH
jgi:hypothetical protein